MGVDRLALVDPESGGGEGVAGQRAERRAPCVCSAQSVAGLEQCAGERKCLPLDFCVGEPAELRCPVRSALPIELGVSAPPETGGVIGGALLAGLSVGEPSVPLTLVGGPLQVGRNLSVGVPPIARGLVGGTLAFGLEVDGALEANLLERLLARGLRDGVSGEAARFRSNDQHANAQTQ